MAIGAKRFDELSTTSPEPDGSRFIVPSNLSAFVIQRLGVQILGGEEAQEPIKHLLRRPGRSGRKSLVASDARRFAAPKMKQNSGRAGQAHFIRVKKKGPVQCLGSRVAADENPWLRPQSNATTSGAPRDALIADVTPIAQHGAAFGLRQMMEDQMCAFTTDFDRKTAGFSPDRVDALVWALTDLLVEPMPGEAMIEFYRLRAREAAEKKAAAEAAERHPAT